ncbi:MAG TPA: S8 family serine peptidase, partial [Steroidobacteraceae bacterium]|nr:S8 family serine peptidase [Steroidobacteraceae bacterium]
MNIRLLLLLAATATSSSLYAADGNGGEATVTTPYGFIVQYRDTLDPPSARSKARADDLAIRVHTKLRATRAIGPRLQAIDLVPDDTSRSATDVLRELRLDPRVEYVVMDERRQPQALPNDPLFVNQWYLQADQPAAINAAGAWNITTGESDVVVAVLDTGIRYDHPDLGRTENGGRMLPGYDFVSGESNGGFLVANDNSGRDPDPSDPGDWITSADKNLPLFANCDTSNSSWHGTRVAGMIAASTNNSAGIAGGTWGARLLPVRVLGKCGGRDSDILAGMRWAAGLPVPGVPDNPHPAKVLNLSLGSSGSCSAAYAQLLSELNGRGVLVVTS